jgi:hypothetical protein
MELVEKDLDARQFGIFGLLCRELKSITLAAFQRRFFNTRHHMPQLNSLENLIEISKYPQFGPTVHTLEIYMDHFLEDPPSTWDFPRPDDLSAVNEEEYKSAFEDQKYMERTGLDLAYLASAFNRLINCKAVRICDLEQPWGAASMKKKVGISPTRRMELPESIDFVKRAFQVIFAAVMASGLKLESFDIALGTAWDPIGPTF